MKTAEITRRYFLKASVAVGGGFMLSCSTRPDREDRGAPSSAQEVALNAWLRIGTDDRVTLICSQSEMGQGVMTTLPAVLAEELCADWDRVTVEFSPAGEPWRNPARNWQFTGNSESTTAFFDLLRHMGASAREMLIAAAADRWAASPSECAAESGKVYHRPSRRSLPFGSLAEAAARKSAPEKPTLKRESEWKLLGKSLPRVELADKLNGKAVFGMDVRVPGMVFAAVRHSPVFGGTVAGFDKSQVTSMPGVLDVVGLPGAVAVVAKTYWEAKKALDRLEVKFDPGPLASLDSEALSGQYRKALDGDRWLTVRSEGSFKDPEYRIKSGFKETLAAEYESQFLAHATMEPMNCTAHVTKDACQIWGPLQGPELAKLVAGQVTGLPPERIQIHRTLLGGGFGRRLLVDFVVQAVLTSKAVGFPVQVIWSREEDMRHDSYRPATLQRISAGLDERSEPLAMHHEVVSPTILKPVFPPAVSDTLDPSCLEGLMESHYRVPNVRVDFHLLKIEVPTSVLRTTGYGPNIFAVESFIDELAHKAGKDPYRFRRELIENKRALAVLDLAAKEAGWETPPPPGIARGIAYAEAFRTHIAHVVELSVQEDKVRIQRIVCVIDCGTVLDPDITRSSLEGGTVWGLSAAFKSSISFKDGGTVESNWHDFKILQIDETPRIDVHFINSGARPLGGTGEVGPVTVVPAVANAIFAATGKRYRSLPLSRFGLRLS